MELVRYMPTAISSRGIVADQNGNFYIATGPGGASVCLNADTGAPFPGGLLLLRRPDGGGTCFYFNDIVDSRDAALSPDVKVAYKTLSRENVVTAIRTMEFPGKVMRGKKLQ